MNNFSYSVIDRDGNESVPVKVHYTSLRTRVLLECPNFDQKRLQRLLEICCENPGHPVDLDHFVKGALVFSRRIRWQGAKLSDSAIMLPGQAAIR